tara:strand:+ start:173 stop:943 length:771 start_codon:yes stop_codon:yes gene_type:complete
MSFLDQVLAARRSNLGLLSPKPLAMYGTPPINPNPNVSTIDDGGYGANTTNPLLPISNVKPPTRIGLMGESILDAVSRARKALTTPEGFEEAGERAIEPTPMSNRQAFKKNLAASESGGNPTNVVNYRGYMGKYQFGDARLTDYKNSTGETFTNQEFLNDLELQEKVYNWHDNDNREHITRNKLDKYIGTKIKGVEVTLEGMLAVSHLGGQTGLIKFLESGGSYNPDDNPDPNVMGTTLLDYLDTHNLNKKAKRKE